MPGIEVLEGAGAKLVDCVVEKNNSFAAGPRRTSARNSTMGGASNTDEPWGQWGGCEAVTPSAGATLPPLIEVSPPGADSPSELAPEASVVSASAGILPSYGAQVWRRVGKERASINE